MWTKGVWGNVLGSGLWLHSLHCFGIQKSFVSKLDPHQLAAPMYLMSRYWDSNYPSTNDSLHLHMLVFSFLAHVAFPSCIIGTAVHVLLYQMRDESRRIKQTIANAFQVLINRKRIGESKGSVVCGHEKSWNKISARIHWLFRQDLCTELGIARHLVRLVVGVERVRILVIRVTRVESARVRAEMGDWRPILVVSVTTYYSIIC